MNTSYSTFRPHLEYPIGSKMMFLPWTWYAAGGEQKSMPPGTRSLNLQIRDGDVPLVHDENRVARRAPRESDRRDRTFPGAKPGGPMKVVYFSAGALPPAVSVSPHRDAPLALAWP